MIKLIPGKLKPLYDVNYMQHQAMRAKKQASKQASDIATHYVTTRCINSDPVAMGAAVYCYAYDALLAGGSSFAVRMNCEPLVTRMEQSNAAPAKPVARKPRKRV